jgi:hypothetical protein
MRMRVSGVRRYVEYDVDSRMRVLEFELVGTARAALWWPKQEGYSVL